MEGLEKIYSKMVRDAKSAASSSSSSLSDLAHNLMQDKRGSGSNMTTYDAGSGILVNRPLRGVSVCTCSKLCAAFFVAGVIVGYTLKRRVRRWASKLLRRMKDD